MSKLKLYAVDMPNGMTYIGTGEIPTKNAINILANYIVVPTKDFTEILDEKGRRLHNQRVQKIQEHMRRKYEDYPARSESCQINLEGVVVHHLGPLKSKDEKE